jgi:N-acetylmuramoyl-L-alanine amidase
MSRNCRITAALAIALLAAAPLAARAACDASNFPIAVDIGHTAQSPGATSARGKPEFEYNLALGRTVAAALHNAGFPVEMIVVSGDGKTQLRNRVDKANALDPRLLISIHHDSAQARYLKTWEVGGRLLKYTDRFSGYSLFVSRANAKFEVSSIFATRIADRLLGAGLGFSTHHAENIQGERKPLLDPARGIYEFRNLRVLKETAMPAVLLEAGVILNRDEEVALATPQRQLAISDAIATAALQMCGDERADSLALR